MGPWDGLGARGYGAMGLWGACRMLDTAPERQARRADANPNPKPLTLTLTLTLTPT